MVSLASAAQAGRPLINTERACEAVAKYYGKKWGGSGNYETKGCYYYENGKYGGKAYYGGYHFTNQNKNTGDGKAKNGKRRFDRLCSLIDVGGSRDYQALRYFSTGVFSGGQAINCDCMNKEAKKLWKWDSCN